MAKRTYTRVEDVRDEWITAIMDGQEVYEAGQALGLSERTIRRHLQSDEKLRIAAAPEKRAAWQPHEHAYDLAGFESFAEHLVTEDLQPFKLHDFEKTMLRDHFEGATSTIVVIAKKNGKSTLIAALALFHLVMTSEADAIVVASSQRQANVLHKQARGLARRSPGIRSLFETREGIREVRCPYTGGLLRTEVSKPDSVDGAIPTLALVDELHRHKNSDLYGVLRDGLGPRGGQMVTISTAGDDLDSPLGVLRTECLQYADAFDSDDGIYHYRRSDEGDIIYHEWSLPEDGDPDDLEQVAASNPAPWQTAEALRKRYVDPTTTRRQWLRFACNRWEEGSAESAISPEVFDGCRKVGVRCSAEPAAIGLDLGWKLVSDTTALAPVTMDGEASIAGQPCVLVPAGDGSLLDDRAVSTAVLVMAGRIKFDRGPFIEALSEEHRPEVVVAWADAIEGAEVVNGAAIVYDPAAGGQQLVQALAREHRLTVVEFRQTSTALVRADSRLWEALRTKTFVHDWEPTPRSHVLNAIEVPVAGGTAFYFGRAEEGTRKPTDALRAVSMAHDVLASHDGRIPRFERKSRGGGEFGQEAKIVDPRKAGKRTGDRGRGAAFF